MIVLCMLVNEWYLNAFRVTNARTPNPRSVPVSMSKQRRVRSCFDKHLQDKVAVVVCCPASKLERLFDGSKALEAVGDHIVKAGKHTRRDNLDAGGVGVSVPENTDYVNFLEVRRRHW